jgi:hypothetical protein
MLLIHLDEFVRILATLQVQMQGAKVLALGRIISRIVETRMAT